ncbi:quinoprotein dehydrogenase-associated SoxYZ-like carrier [Hyphomicrobium sp. D-2]|uniref:quinoprotein dehydrogenase-associated SoxYZ-like carrier n=1 Tax=Hyphomicrobium sp. D-2 TaxID=3041621 RepID=UPI002457C533|nr:quinoprotein dehydrogenase-associated SoxYZ-like carrier [Hyphomicrobium sp. D-2]MDH4981034.1 quinoprotein dehydrogenase-associated SoxYZ-like carrier [Hyphomicrobium sp. D-2]
MSATRFIICVAAAFLASFSAALADDSAWSSIRKELFADRAISEDSGMVRVVAPKRAEDAAVVPITVYISGQIANRAKRLSLIIDENPAPLAAAINFDTAYREGGDIGDRTIEARVRLNDMSAVRAVLETDDGTLHAASQYVTGAGGCTSTTLKDMDEAMASLGKTRLHVYDDATRGEAWRDLQTQIRHPNFSGMQIDIKTNTYLPAHFVERVDLTVGDRPFAQIESGMSVSENPSFRISFARHGRFPVKAVVRDTNGNLFDASSGS